jgi:KaiC/GvpD/RAD55 family RecA-like ATPase
MDSTVPIPIDIPGLDTLIPQIAGGRIVIVEGGADLTNSFFLRRLETTALGQGNSVTIVTSKDPSELREGLAMPAVAAEGPTNGGSTAHAAWEELEEALSNVRSGASARLKVVALDTLKDLEEHVPRDGLLAVDSFSFLTLDLDAHALARLLRKLHGACRRLNAVAALATDRGMFDPRSEAIAIHLADGYVQFHAREGSEGLMRFLRIPKWTDGRFLDRNIYYDFDGKRLAVDLRQRVI